MILKEQENVIFTAELRFALRTYNLKVSSPDEGSTESGEDAEKNFNRKSAKWQKEIT